MKKLLIGIIACLGIGLATTTPVMAYADEVASSEAVSSEEISSEEEIIEEENPEIVYPCTVVVDKTIGGEVLLDITEGNIGDVVTLRASAYILYSLKSVKVNGVELSPNSEGNYTFTLAEGENILVIEFTVSEEQMQTMAELFAKAKDGEWSDIFSVENILTFISWAITTLLSSGFFLTLIKNKKIKSKTAEEIATVVEERVNSASSTAIESFLKNILQPVTNKMSTGLVDMEDSMKILIRCFVLSQENTPESRLAIIKELSNLKTSSQELSEQVKALIGEEIAKNKQVEEEKAKSLEELKAANDAIVIEETIKEEIKGSY